MAPKLYVSNVASGTTRNQLRDLFSVYGNVAEVNIGCYLTLHIRRSVSGDANPAVAASLRDLTNIISLEGGATR
jgi:RNA recognition motif. (a.k.a. RRM, RBD, or RNP domain)